RIYPCVLSARNSLYVFSFFFIILRRPPGATLFPYTTLFRSQGRPAGLRAQFFLAHIVAPATARFTDTAAHHHQIDDAAIRHVHRSEEHTSELQSRENLVCRLLLEKKKLKTNTST